MTLNSDTGNRTPSYRVKGGNVSRYTISDYVTTIECVIHLDVFQYEVLSTDHRSA